MTTSKNLLRTLLLMLILSVAPHAPAGTLAKEHWIDAWAAAPDSGGPPLDHQTVRQIVRLSASGSKVRIRLSNLFGTAPVTIGPVHIAKRLSGSAIKPETDRAVSFSGKSTIRIAPGANVLSDPIELAVTALEDLAVSMYLPTRTGPSTVHALGVQTAYITLAGDQTASATLPEGEVASARFFLTDVEVESTSSKQLLVAFGDSITDGYGSTPNVNARWPDFLVQRLQSDPAYSSIAVANSGISGNRILNDGAGPSALKRFDRDVLTKPGVKWVVLLEGINDIGETNESPNPKDHVSAQQIIDGMKQLISRAHAKGIKVLGATLTPFGGVDWPYHSASGEIARRAVNTWIRNSGAFDGIVDFDQLTRDPEFPDRFLPAYDSGDHLHPSDAGYKAMASAIDLHFFDHRD